MEPDCCFLLGWFSVRLGTKSALLSACWAVVGWVGVQPHCCSLCAWLSVWWWSGYHGRCVLWIENPTTPHLICRVQMPPQSISLSSCTASTIWNQLQGIQVMQLMSGTSNPRARGIPWPKATDFKFAQIVFVLTNDALGPSYDIPCFCSALASSCQIVFTVATLSHNYLRHHRTYKLSAAVGRSQPSSRKTCGCTSGHLLLLALPGWRTIQEGYFTYLLCEGWQSGPAMQASIHVTVQACFDWCPDKYLTRIIWFGPANAPQFQFPK